MKDHLEFNALVDYWFGGLAPERERALEQHFFACAHCAGRLEELAALGAGIRAVFRAGALGTVVSRGFVEGLKREGLRLREYRVAPGASVDCTIAAADDFVISRLEAPLAGVERVDLVWSSERGETHTFEDIPFDPAAGEVLFCPPAAKVKTLPAHTDRMRLLAVEAGGARTLGEYTFVHTPG